MSFFFKFLFFVCKEYDVKFLILEEKFLILFIFCFFYYFEISIGKFVCGCVWEIKLCDIFE